MRLINAISIAILPEIILSGNAYYDFNLLTQQMLFSFFVDFSKDIFYDFWIQKKFFQFKY